MFLDQTGNPVTPANRARSDPEDGTGLDKEARVLSKCGGKPMEGFRRGSSINWFNLWKVALAAVGRSYPKV